MAGDGMYETGETGGMDRWGEMDSTGRGRPRVRPSPAAMGYAGRGRPATRSVARHGR